MANIHYTHEQPEIKTVRELLFQTENTVLNTSSNKSFPVVINLAAKEFLDFTDGYSTNREKIFERYTKEEKEKYKNTLPEDLLIKINTELVLPSSKVNREALYTYSNIVVQNHDTPAFVAEEVQKIIAEEGYVQDFKFKNVTAVEGVREMYPFLSVWVWCRSLNGTDFTSNSVINVTPFIKSINTSVGQNGGQFNFTLAPVTGSFAAFGTGVVELHKLDLTSGGFIADSSTHRIENGKAVRNRFVLHNLISENDIVFVRFETLKQEKERRKRLENQFLIPVSELAENVYDMIGLVDKNSLNTNHASATVNHTVAGRDLIKLFIEDGSYFYPLEFTKGMFYTNGKSKEDGGIIMRSQASGKLMTAAAYLERSIGFSLKFILRQLSTIQIAPERLFESWGTRRTKQYNLDAEAENRLKQRYASQADEARREALKFIKLSRKRERLQLGAKGLEETRALEIFDQTKVFLNHLMENQLEIEDSFNGRLNGWLSHTYESELLGKNVFPKSFHNVLFVPTQNVQATNINEDGVDAVNEVYQYLKALRRAKTIKPKVTGDLVKGIWQIVKLVIDENVTHRRIVDSSIAAEQGSILNSIRKVCQSPFVEFTTDTFGDQFYLTVRQPPHTQKAIKSALEIQGNVIDIHDMDVLDEALELNSGDVYSWYRLTPQGMLFGGGEQMSLAILPAILFEEYAEIWGSKPLDLVTNYIPYNPAVGQHTTTNMNYLEKQAYEDLKYLIDSNAYLPFTRKGSITIVGDRRIKRGMFVRLQGTGEVFYVDNVSQAFAVQENTVTRTTTLQLSRGMVEKYIHDNEFNYFNVIETPLSQTDFEGEAKKRQDHIFSKWKVNNQAFNFFLRKGQFNH